MRSLTEGIQGAIDYMESHLTEPLSVGEIAAQAHLSAFHFQRLFRMLCGFTVGEYLRGRRLTLAAGDLTASGGKIIDLALKYGYDSPDSFTRAFTRFHGISPSAARKREVEFHFMPPLRIRLILEGGTMMEYKIVQKAAFTVIGKARRFSFDNSYEEIPKFWQEHMSSPEARSLCGVYGLCREDGEADFEYLIADDYMPWKDIPEGWVTRTLPAGTWAVFPCRGEMPKALQEVNTRIWNEWLPSCSQYQLAGSYNIEFYALPADQPSDTYSEIWIPVVLRDPQ